MNPDFKKLLQLFNANGVEYTGPRYTKDLYVLGLPQKNPDGIHDVFMDVTLLNSVL